MTPRLTATDPNTRSRSVRSIFVDQSGYHLTNVGDAAMLQVAVDRLRVRFPDARIHVVTYFPDRLARLCPGTIAVMPRVHTLARRGRFPRKVEYGLSQAGRILVPRVPGTVRLATWTEARFPRRNARDLLPALAEADLVVAVGGGYLTDAFRLHALGVLELLAWAQRRGVPTAMMGQGIGPIDDPRLAHRVVTVARRLHLLTLREGLEGPEMLARGGVPSTSWRVTGDDAIELAHAHRNAGTRDALGLNLRVAGYAGTAGGEAARAVTEAIAGFRSRRGAPCVVLPVSYDRRSADLEALRDLFGDTVQVPPGLERLPLPADLALATARCRVIVTGSYHAAVFGASQGVPVVCLSRSRYYDIKFQGLRDLFGDGCTIVRLDGMDVANHLGRAIVHAWDSAGEVRASLLRAADRQIERGAAAYDELARVAIGA